MNATLFRADAETRDADLEFSHVGPGHERAYFSLIPLAGYAAVNQLEARPHYAPPFRIYSMGGHPITTTARTIPAAKRAVRRWIKTWLASAAQEVRWQDEDTGVHFTGVVNGIEVSNYYFCPRARGHWHKGFRVWFGGTYYTTEFASPEQARATVQATYTRWLANAQRLLHAEERGAA